MFNPWLAGVFVLLSLSLAAQPQRGFEAGGWLGAAHFFGDLNTSYKINKPGPLGSLALRYNINQRLAAMAKLSAFRISADDAVSTNAFEKNRNLSFFSGVYEGSAQFEFNFFPYKHGDKERYFTPYLFVGASAYRFDPKTRYNDAVVRLQPLGTEGQAVGKEYSLIQPALLYGMGFKYDLSPIWSLNIELSARSLYTDYLDDVSTIYPTPDQLAGRDPLSVILSNRSLVPNIEPGRQRGDRRETDGLGMLSIGLMYFFNPLPCPKISQ
jgi:hypothetical protein